MCQVQSRELQKTTKSFFVTCEKRKKRNWTNRATEQSKKKKISAEVFSANQLKSEDNLKRDWFQSVRNKSSPTQRFTTDFPEYSSLLPKKWVKKLKE